MAGAIRNGLHAWGNRFMGPNTLVQKSLKRILSETPDSWYDEVTRKLEVSPYILALLQTVPLMHLVVSQFNAKLAYSNLSVIPGLYCTFPTAAMYLLLGVDIKHFPEFPSDVEFCNGKRHLDLGAKHSLNPSIAHAQPLYRNRTSSAFPASLLASPTTCVSSSLHRPMCCRIPVNGSGSSVRNTTSHRRDAMFPAYSDCVVFSKNIDDKLYTRNLIAPRRHACAFAIHPSQCITDTGRRVSGRVSDSTGFAVSLRSTRCAETNRQGTFHPGYSILARVVMVALRRIASGTAFATGSFISRRHDPRVSRVRPRLESRARSCLWRLLFVGGRAEAKPVYELISYFAQERVRP